MFQILIKFQVRFGNVSTMEPIVLGLVPQERYLKVWLTRSVKFSKFLSRISHLLFKKTWILLLLFRYLRFATYANNKAGKAEPPLEHACNATNPVANKASTSPAHKEPGCCAKKLEITWTMSNIVAIVNIITRELWVFKHIRLNMYISSFYHNMI